MRTQPSRLALSSLLALIAVIAVPAATHAVSNGTSGQLKAARGLAAGTSAAAIAQAASTSLALTQSCMPLTLQREQVARCEIEVANDTTETQVVDVDTSTSKELDVVGTEGGATRLDAHHAQLHDVTLDGVQPGVPSVDPGSLFGYIPLDAFGVTPVPIGDEQILNFNVPAFVYDDETWDVIGVDSNGYIVVGGGTNEDNNCCDLPTGPDPARPNNVLAPFWTDLDGTGAPGIYATVLTDGVNSWVVIEFRVNVFGTTSSRVFQTWIGIDGVQDITFAYDPGNLPANPGQPFLVGAENTLGQGEVSATLPTQDLRVSSTDATPGETVSYAVYVQGVKHGTGTVTTELSTPSGSTTATTEIEVLRKK